MRRYNIIAFGVRSMRLLVPSPSTVRTLTEAATGLELEAESNSAGDLIQTLVVMENENSATIRQSLLDELRRLTLQRDDESTAASALHFALNLDLLREDLGSHHNWWMVWKEFGNQALSRARELSASDAKVAMACLRFGQTSIEEFYRWHRLRPLVTQYDFGLKNSSFIPPAHDWISSVAGRGTSDVWRETDLHGVLAGLAHIFRATPPPYVSFNDYPVDLMSWEWREAFTISEEERGIASDGDSLFAACILSGILLEVELLLSGQVETPVDMAKMEALRPVFMAYVNHEEGQDIGKCLALAGLQKNDIPILEQWAAGQIKLVDASFEEISHY